MEVPFERQKVQSLIDDEITELAWMGKQIEKHYGRPMDIEWAVDKDLPAGGNIFILQARPETVWSQQQPGRRSPAAAARPWTTSSPACWPARRSARRELPRFPSPSNDNGGTMNARTEVRPIDDLRSYIAALEAHGELHRVKTEVDWKFELCHVSKVNEEQKGPALMYENVKGYDIPVFTSAFTTPQRLAIALEQDPSLSMSQLSKKWMELTTKQMVKPVLRRQPAGDGKHHHGDASTSRCSRRPWFYPDDGGRFFVTSGFLVTQDPDTGWTNLGTYRSQVLGKNILGSQIIKGKHGDMHMKKYQERGELMPAAYVVGCDPVLFLAALHAGQRAGRRVRHRRLAARPPGAGVQVRAHRPDAAGQCRDHRRGLHRPERADGRRARSANTPATTRATRARTTRSRCCASSASCTATSRSCGRRRSASRSTTST